MVAVVVDKQVPVVMESWRERVSGLLMAWYPGIEGGHAVADVLLGRVEPGGRLPAEFPTTKSGLPEFDPRARVVRYDRWHGYRLRDHGGPPAAYPFGFGLGYTTWAFGPPTATRVEGGLRVDVEAANTGTRRGATVVQAYVGARPFSSARSGGWGHSAGSRPRPARASASDLTFRRRSSCRAHRAVGCGRTGPGGWRWAAPATRPI